MNLALAIEITSCGDGAYEIHWPATFSAGPVDIFVGRDPASIDFDAPRVVGAERLAQIKGLDPGVRHYFGLRGDNGQTFICAQRDVPLEGAVNFRDLGGYETTDGHRVRWGKLFRSGHLSGLTEAGIAYFSGLSVATVCDFRMSEERANEAMKLPGDPLVKSLEIPPGVKDRFYFHRIFKESTDPNDVVEAIHDVMRSMVNESATRLRPLFDILLGSTDQRILLNCSAGKERTGIATALVLAALGVPRETIYDEFMLSERFFPAENEIPRVLEKYDVDPDLPHARAIIMPLLETRRSYLEVALADIDAKHGNEMAFLEAHYDLKATEIRSLRERYTSATGA